LSAGTTAGTYKLWGSFELAGKQGVRRNGEFNLGREAGDPELLYWIVQSLWVELNWTREIEALSRTKVSPFAI
jgi:hypothetical protein